eukprot:CAMPEP_0197523384 /NCGR_PEP_ID=MMETSP1318-20131121/8320_1 /TAXON_ID=552666 /ORGANISM="Partenskyella glossopodia, Strain RCC365" /LENGTH=196 /DNA_ID=CAMNT_0043076059 /DNA_START=182 /DNA_END=772 /DNA_ORIENTATION=+
MIIPGYEGALLKSIFAVVVGCIAAYNFIPQFRDNEHVQRIRAWIEHKLETWGFTGANGGDNNAANHNRQRAQRGTPSYAQRFDAALRAAKNLPLEEYTHPSELHKEDVKTLRSKLKRRGIDSKDCVEKADLIAKLKDAGTSSESCCICVEDYVTGDLLRVMPKCGHLFHLACVDKWIYESADYSKPVSCPMCKTEL